MSSPFRSLPAVSSLAADPVLAAGGAPERLRVLVARRVIDAARRAITAGEDAPTLATLATRAAEALSELTRPSLTPVVNATGVVLHTNLGRAPLPPEAVARALGPCALEVDLGTGRRGKRRHHAERLLTTLSGAEAALVVNNNAAAVLLMLAGLAAGREVIISRGELVEIGGSFRIPEIMAAAGVRLVEVGTTNRTRVSDYAAAIGPQTTAILRVHPSNYAVVGFTHRPAAGDLAALARERGLGFLHDLGTGTFGRLPAGLAGQGRVAAAIAEGADVCCLSGDKLLGGPQSGLLLGRSALIDQLARHPLARALRPDKLTLAALESTLLAYLMGQDEVRVPIMVMLHARPAHLERRATAIAAALRKTAARVEAIRCEDTIGGGSLPNEVLPGWAVSVRPSRISAAALATRLRGPLADKPPIIAVTREDSVRLHLRTVPPADDPTLTDALIAALAGA